MKVARWRATLMIPRGLALTRAGGDIRQFLARILWILDAQFGVNPLRTVKSLWGVPRYIRDWIVFRSQFKGQMTVMPCLHDWKDNNGSVQNEYFWQDLIVAQNIFASSPKRHIDIGSRVDGFIAHVASFREIESFDIRPTRPDIPGVKVRQVDIMAASENFLESCDSLSCLHALEHFGLGRYGDHIDVEGFSQGFKTMAGMLEPAGKFYLSVPIGNPRVEFNGHRVSAPESILQLAEDNSLRISKFVEITSDGFSEFARLDSVTLTRLSKASYSLGLFIFTKESVSR